MAWQKQISPELWHGSYLDAVQKAAQMLMLILIVMVEQAGPEPWSSSHTLSACLLAQLWLQKPAVPQAALGLVCELPGSRSSGKSPGSVGAEVDVLPPAMLCSCVFTRLLVAGLVLCPGLWSLTLNQTRRIYHPLRATITEGWVLEPCLSALSRLLSEGCCTFWPWILP